MVFSSFGKGEEVTSNGSNGPVLRRFSSIEPKTPSSPLASPGGHDNQIYTLPDHDDAVFADDGEITKDNNNLSNAADNFVPPPPTPGTAASVASHAPWSQRRLRCREVALILVVVIVFICLAVGTALAIIFVNTDPSSPKSLPVIATTPFPTEEIHYNGRLALSKPWSEGEVELKSSLNTDLKNIIMSSPLYKAYLNSSFVNLSANMSLVNFLLTFDKTQLEDIAASSGANTSQGPDDNNASSPLANVVQAALREQVVAQSMDMLLSIRADSIVIIDYIPNTVATTPVTSPLVRTTETTSEETTATTTEKTTPVTEAKTEATTEATTTTTTTTEATTASTATSTTETTTEAATTTDKPVQCLENVLLPCMHTLKSSTFQLPNSLDHMHMQQAMGAYGMLLSARPADASPQCDAVSLLYLCALLFPLCGEGEGGQALHPCDSLCQASLTECGALDGWPSDCNAFPSTNCTSIPPPPPTTTAATTTEMTTTTTTENPLQCSKLEFTTCNELGFNESLLPNNVWNCEDNQCLIAMFENFAHDSIQAGCDRDLTFFCSYFFHGCSYEIDLQLSSTPVKPCFEACSQVLGDCGQNMLLKPDCSGLPSKMETNVQCVELPKDQCINQTSEVCRNLGFTSTTEDSWFSNSIADRENDFNMYAKGTIESKCWALAEFFFCGIVFPTCRPGGEQVLPCRSYCEELRTHCPDTSFPLDCESLPESDPCLRHSDLNITTEAPVTTTTPASTTPKVKCEKLESPLCETFGYTHVGFPNSYGHLTQKQANASYYEFAEASVSKGCIKDIAFYVCVSLFPPCEEGKPMRYPCSSICEETAKCPLLFRQECTSISDPNEETCLKPPPQKACGADEFSCNNSRKCVSQAAVCNQKNDCEDWSDERNCECHKTLEQRCAMGLCIPSFSVCDGKQNCPDNSDEVDCLPNCSKGQFKCQEYENATKCIPPEWVCDGDSDCPTGNDEEYCGGCTSEEFMCTSDHMCIDMLYRCDGFENCVDGSDELSCVFASGSQLGYIYPHLESSEIFPTMCAQGFTKGHGTAICLKLGYPSLEIMKKEKFNISNGDSQDGYFELAEDGEYFTTLGKGFWYDSCLDDMVVAIKCTPRECGVRVPNLANLIINGQDAPPGNWPWVVSMQHVGIHKCGGAIIHPYFVLTAAHCAKDIFGMNLVRVVAGTVNLRDAAIDKTSSFPDHIQVREARRFIQYPGYTRFDGKDIALLELKTPLNYTETIRPICLPDPDVKEVFSRKNLCYVAGWGHTIGVGGRYMNEQQEAKMTLVDTNLCNSTYMWDGAIADREKCAGYFNGLIAACSGDSGSTVACENHLGVWTTVGVTSYVRKDCSVPRYPMVYTDVVPYIDWINNHTVCIFVCANGNCLFDKGMLCDSNDDCGDRSDEVQHCAIATNCTFDDKFQCGYDSNWAWVSQGGPNYINRYPLYDHTHGGYPGYLELGNVRAADLMPPRTNLQTPHCVRFHYHGRGKYQQGMSIYIYNVGKSRVWQMVWDVMNGNGPDQWLMGTFDLEAGSYEIAIRTFDTAIWAVDDIWVLEGSCNQTACLPGEFMCMTHGTKNCLPLAVKCNIVIDCDNAEDEKDCTDSSYTCDFENGNVCGLRQHTDDATVTEWQMVNASGTPISMADHTSGLDSGTMLKIETVSMLLADKVLASMDVYLRSEEHCFTFYYFSDSPYSLELTLTLDGTTRTLFSFTSRHTEAWTPTQVSLPAVSPDRNATLTFVVMGGGMGSVLREVILLDDMSISRGQCQAFECTEAGSILCEGEAYCVPKARVCDHVPDCAKSTDEISCECAESEYKCPTGPCISISRTCDFVPDCADESDEGSICDVKRTVSCDFEDAFQCGYTVNTTSPNFRWSRAHGHKVDPGPGFDHTFITDEDAVGHYMLANSLENGNYTALTSAPFTSTGTGLLFYYHAYHFLHEQFATGRLVLVVNNLDANTQMEVWSAVPDQHDVWKRECVTLPAGRFTVSFIALRGGDGISANIAVDDVQHLDETCGTFLAGHRIASQSQRTKKQPAWQPDPVCNDGEYQCRSGMCIDAIHVCDRMEDCQDGRDEWNCD